MKNLIILFLAIAAFVSLSACRTDVEERRDPTVHSSSTTTTSDESTVRRPADSTTTTETRSSN
jgi:predicted small lipoprotein YifL